ncbi:hypothetical protein QBC33DRAFT_553476 [Phialemonium atrogriseum]|uniref:HNH nuclease domain-containing protein n=1 Tax=Phialemonium atrogriseum TaxID=1093897 RepID=A0AAJ0BRA0_9PEZI|nr:uncharacterized protein QBC33DRAFT_553476 [Phialemonium atrogriseum]KAK1761674.1 hypothetical protein QBC33DRAFT_553476 [Phialemonium atrogriseum]
MGSGRNNRRSKGKGKEIVDDPPASENPESPSTPKKEKGKGPKDDPSAAKITTTLATPDKVPGMININDTSPISLPSARSCLSAEACAALDVEEEGHSAAKRRWSDVSKSSKQAVEDAKRSRTYGHETTPRFKSYVRDLHENLMEETLVLHQDRLTRLEKSRTILQAEYHAGDTGLTSSEFNNLVRDQEVEIGNQRAKVISLHNSRLLLTAEMRQDLALQKAVDPFEWDYIDGLLNRFKAPPRSTVVLKVSREDSDQGRFRAEVLRLYDGVQLRKIVPKKTEKYTWCAITADFHPPGSVCVAHLVRHSIGDVVAERFFGKPTHPRGHLWNPANGIPMLKVYEELLDQAEIAFVPGDTPGSWKVHYLANEDADRGQGEENTLHGRELTFRTDFRPAARYLYFRFATNILLRQRHEVPGWWNDRFEFGRKEMWASPGDYLRTSMMNLLARNIAQVPHGEADKAFPPDKCADADADTDADNAELEQHLSEHTAEQLLSPVIAALHMATQGDDEGDDEGMDETPSRSTNVFGIVEPEDDGVGGDDGQ